MLLAAHRRLQFCDYFSLHYPLYLNGNNYMLRCLNCGLNCVWGIFILFEAAFGVYTAISRKDEDWVMVACWILASASLHASGLLVKDCIARRDNRGALWVCLMCALIIAVFPTALASCGLGTYIAHTNMDKDLLNRCLVLGCLFCAYAYSLTVTVFIIRFVKNHSRPREPSISPTLLDHQEHSLHAPLSSEEIESIPQFRAIDSLDECPICKDVISWNMKIMSCPTCNKSMHSSCMYQSLSLKPLCPMCRANWRQTFNLQ